MSVQTIGKHKITNASIESPLVDRMLAGEKINVIYSDPPWGDGNLKYWATMNKKMTGEEFNPLSYSDLLNRIVSLIKNYVDGWAFIETGLRWEAEAVASLGSVLHGITTHKIYYNQTLPNILIAGHTSKGYTWDFDPSGFMDQKLVTEVLKSVCKENDIVLDPCCGMGWTAQACVNLNLVFRGNEFNKKRLEKTIARLK